MEIDTLIHEAGAAQMEVNFLHGDALDLADQMFLFKRTVREAAMRHKIYATFMAKPMENEPGSAMHIHQSVVDARDRAQRLHRRATASRQPLFLHYIAGPAALHSGGDAVVRALREFLPPLRSATRRRPSTCSGATTTARWDCACRARTPRTRRVENRVAGADVNPYLAIAASLACGYLGMTSAGPDGAAGGQTPTSCRTGCRATSRSAAQLLGGSAAIAGVLGERFVTVYRAIKEREYETFFRVISPWEREFLLLNV